MPRVTTRREIKLGSPSQPHNGHPEGLTPIPVRIHLPATAEGDAPEYTEMESVIIENFLNTPG